MAYKLTQFESIIRLADGAFIPPDINNSDYQEYLKWVEDGNQPESADLVIEPAPLSAEEKLKMSGLTVDELKALLGLK